MSEHFYPDSDAYNLIQAEKIRKDPKRLKAAENYLETIKVEKEKEIAIINSIKGDTQETPEAILPITTNLRKNVENGFFNQKSSGSVGFHR